MLHCIAVDLALVLRHATHAVIFRVISGSFLSPKASRKAAAADGGGIFEISIAVRNFHI